MQPSYLVIRILQGVTVTLLLALALQVWQAFPVLAVAAGLIYCAWQLGRRARRALWSDAQARLQDLVDADASPESVHQACQQAFELSLSGSLERLLTELEIDRFRVLEGDVHPSFELELQGRLAQCRSQLGGNDASAAQAAQNLGLFYWQRARICLEQEGLVEFHHPDRTHRIGINIRKYFQDDQEDGFEELGEDLGASRAFHLASVTFHWRDLYFAEQYLEEAREGFQRALGERHPRTAMAGSVLAQVLAVNQDSDRAVKLAGRSLATLSTEEGPESHNLAPAYEALGMAYHFEGHEAEASIYLKRSESLAGMVLPPRPPGPMETPAQPQVEAEPGTADFLVHLPEEADPIIH